MYVNIIVYSNKLLLFVWSPLKKKRKKNILTNTYTTTALKKSYKKDFFPSLFKRLYPHNFERALKSMPCVQIESIHIDGFKNVKKNSKWYLVAMATDQNPRKGAKTVFMPAKIFRVREIVQN